MSKFRKIFRIETSRLKDWNYSSPWWYYITINTKNHIEYFGTVKNEKMILNELGKIAEKYWNEIPKYSPNVEIDYSLIMPNHIHGIIIINPSIDMIDRESEKKGCRDAINCVSTDKKRGGITGFNNPQLNPNSLSNIVRQFKARSSVEMRKLNSSFSWQSRFYDRIIRDDKELLRIRKYILDNPLKWYFERNNHENICDF